MEYRILRTETSLEHHGILGQKWGIRRFQNADGSLTPEGRARYGSAADFDGDDTSYRGNSKWYKSEHAAKSAEARAKRAEERKAKRQAEKIAKKEAKAAALKAMQDAEDEAVRIQNERKAIAKEINDLSKMNARYLTDDELRRLNDRARAENDFKRNYQPESIVTKKGKDYALQMADALIRQVVIPSIVATGKAEVQRYVKAAVKNGELPEVYADIIEKEFKTGGKKKPDTDKKSKKSPKGLFKKKGS